MRAIALKTQKFVTRTNKALRGAAESASEGLLGTGSVSACLLAAIGLAQTAQGAPLIERELSFELQRESGSATLIDSRFALPVVEANNADGQAYSLYVGGNLQLENSFDFFTGRQKWNVPEMGAFIGAELLLDPFSSFQAKLSFEQSPAENTGGLDLRYARSSERWAVDLVGGYERFETDPNSFRFGDKGSRLKFDGTISWFDFPTLADDARLSLRLRGTNEFAVTNTQPFFFDVNRAVGPNLEGRLRFSTSIGKREDFRYPGRIAVGLLADEDGRREFDARIDYEFIRVPQFEFAMNARFSYDKAGGLFDNERAEARLGANIALQPSRQVLLNVEPYVRRELLAPAQYFGVLARAQASLTDNLSLSFQAEFEGQHLEGRNFLRRFTELRATWLKDNWTAEAFASATFDRFNEQSRWGGSLRYDRFMGFGESVFFEGVFERVRTPFTPNDYRLAARVGLQF